MKDQKHPKHQNTEAPARTQRAGASPFWVGVTDSEQLPRLCEELHPIYSVEFFCLHRSIAI